MSSFGVDVPIRNVISPVRLVYYEVLDMEDSQFSVVSEQWSVQRNLNIVGAVLLTPPEALYQTYLPYPFAEAKRLYITAIFLPSAGGSFRIRATNASQVALRPPPVAD